jgi:O-antigen/teichoic acid export membrane protein
MIEAIIGPAGPVLDILGHRRWLLVNSGSGLLTWLILSILLVQPYAAMGMAIAVAGGILVPALLALIQLRVANRLDALSGRLGIGVGVGVLAALLFAVAKYLIAPLGAWAQAIAICMLLPPALWAGLRFGLKRSDREALGRPAVRLRLI